MASKQTKETTIVEGMSTWYLRQVSGAQRNLEMAATKMCQISAYEDAKSLKSLGLKYAKRFWNEVEMAGVEENG